MKKIILLLTLRPAQCITLCFLLLTLVVNAQTPPNAFNYSAVARNVAGLPIATTTIGIQITILKTSPTGVSQYSENHFINTDAFGLFNLVIGAGAVQSGSMATIDWSNDNYYLKVGMDAAGGTNFLTMGTTQLLSVPYALYAKSAGNVSAGNGFSHFIGEAYGGGVIFHLWTDDNGVEHGLIVDLTDLSSSQVWSNVTLGSVGGAFSHTDGISNSNAIVAQPGHTNSAAALCLNSTNSGFNDWYLPARDELYLCFGGAFDHSNLLVVNNTLSNINGATTIPLLSTTVRYWSSTESPFGQFPEWADFVEKIGGKFPGTDTFNANKSATYHVRAIRAF